MIELGNIETSVYICAYLNNFLIEDVDNLDVDLREFLLFLILIMRCKLG